MWTINAVSVMAKSKDTMRSQLSSSDIDIIVTNIAKLGATSVSLSCPFDNYSDYPDPKPTTGYIQTWVASIRSHGMNVYWRNQWINAVAIYDAPKYTPTSNPSIALGASATVLNGTDTTSYLYKTYNFIKSNPTLFASGDVWAPFGEGENMGIGGATTDMFSSYAVLGQFLVDLKTVSDSAFTDIGVTGVITGMTPVNGGTVRDNDIGSAYWSQIGKCCIDHYISTSLYSSQLDTIHTNAGVDIYIGEWGSCADSGGSLNGGFRADEINKVFNVFKNKSYIKGVCYFQSVSSATNTENILDSSTYLTLQSGRTIQKYFKEMPRVLVN